MAKASVQRFIPDVPAGPAPVLQTKRNIPLPNNIEHTPGGLMPHTAGATRPHLRTYGELAEKFAHSTEDPLRRLAKPGIEASGRGVSWGMGGSIPQGTKKVPPPGGSGDFEPKQGKKFLAPAETGHFGLEDTIGHKRVIYEPASGVSRRQLRSDEQSLEESLNRKGRVAEEDRVDHRTIHRMAPPGLKGYMGAEYWNDYWKQDGVVARTVMRPSRDDLAEMALRKAAERGSGGAQRKTFKQKKAAEDLREQQELVATLQLECELEAESDEEGEAEY